MAGEPGTIDHQLRQAAAERGDSPFLEFRNERLTYGALEAASARVANGLLELGVSPGENVALFMGNRTEFVLGWMGAGRAGMPVIPVNAGLKGDGLAHVIDHSDAVTLVVEEELLGEVLAVRDRMPKIRNLVVAGGEVPSGAVSWMDVAQGAPGGPDVATGPDDPMMIMYTSGTTGLPKGVVIRHSRIMAPHLLMMLCGVTPDDVPYTCLPLFHANAALISFWGAFNLGTRLVLSRRFSASRLWDEVRASGATTFNALGAMMTILWKQPPRPDDADNPVRLLVSAACPKDIMRPFEARFGLTIIEAYGTVEGGLTIAGPEAPPGSIGKPVAGFDMAVIDDDGNPCPPNVVGELVSRPAGSAATVEYFKNEEAAAKKTAGGWLHTGDRAYVDDEGWFWFVDRGEHFMRRRGENISSTEVEAVIERHPDVLECAAYGIPSELGED
ncbi:MAG TPA: AMP-binding protein, partial [Acidimicrobiia bacterium]|nr:AMP-binding protein [Acidimicrobiia bacterium]